MHAQFLEGFINIKINTKENPKSKFEQDEYILKVTVGNEAASGCKLYLCMVKLLRACGHFLSQKALIFHAKFVVQLNWLLFEAQCLIWRSGSKIFTGCLVLLCWGGDRQTGEAMEASRPLTLLYKVGNRCLRFPEGQR